jgi:hypothetical protein
MEPNIIRNEFKNSFYILNSRLDIIKEKHVSIAECACKPRYTGSRDQEEHSLR